VVELEEYRSSSLAAGQRRRKSAGASLTSTPKNRVWDFEITPSGRPCADLDLSWETAIGSVQYTYKNASGRAEFLTRDPLGFKAGPNMYTYVRQNPWTHFDPEGLDGNDRVQGYAQGVTNGLIDTVNTVKNLSVGGLGRLIPNIPHIDNSSHATNQSDFQHGVLGGSVFFAGGSTVIGAGSLALKAEQVLTKVVGTTGALAAGGASARLVAADQIKSLGSFQGRSAVDIEAQLKTSGYTSVPAKNGGTIWTKPGADANTSAVRLDPANPKAPPGNADAVPHAHKETVPTNQVQNGNYPQRAAQTYNDAGQPTSKTDYAANHIPIKPSSPPPPKPPPKQNSS